MVCVWWGLKYRYSELVLPEEIRRYTTSASCAQSTMVCGCELACSCWTELSPPRSNCKSTCNGFRFASTVCSSRPWWDQIVSPGCSFETVSGGASWKRYNTPRIVIQGRVVSFFLNRMISCSYNAKKCGDSHRICTIAQLTLINSTWMGHPKAMKPKAEYHITSFPQTIHYSGPEPVCVYKGYLE